MSKHWDLIDKGALCKVIDVNMDKYPEGFPIHLLFDAHQDNPKADRAMMQRHLREICNAGGAVLIGGDFYCAMQGKYDKRACKSSVRPENQSGEYLDTLVTGGQKQLANWVDNIAVFGYGNHETSILRHQETDLIKRTAHRLGCMDALGAYGGWLVVKMRSNGRVRATYKIRYFHGSGGGGPVTKGVIQTNRRQCIYSDVDAVVTGHVHEDWAVTIPTESMNHKTGEQIIREVLHVCTPTYKEEYKGARKGWHIERGAAPKPVGSTALILELRRNSSEQRGYKAFADTRKLR